MTDRSERGPQPPVSAWPNSTHYVHIVPMFTHIGVFPNRDTQRTLDRAGCSINLNPSHPKLQALVTTPYTLNSEL